MGGIPCAKAAIDGPGTLGAQAAAMASFAARRPAPGVWAELADECRTLVKCVDGFALAFPFIYEALEPVGEDAPDAQDDIRAGLKLSYRMCDWAKELKAVRHRATNAPIDALALTEKVIAWQDETGAWLAAMVEKYMPNEYRVPKP